MNEVVPEALPFTSAGETPMATPLAGVVEATVNIYVIAGGGVPDPLPELPQAASAAHKEPASALATHSIRITFASGALEIVRCAATRRYPVALTPVNRFVCVATSVHVKLRIEICHEHIAVACLERSSSFSSVTV